MENIFQFAKESGTMMTALLLNPHYNDNKGRVTKGESKGHFQWNKTKWIEKNVRITPTTNAIPTAWMIYLKKIGMYVIDIDVKGSQKPKDIMKQDAYDSLFNSSSYIVETGSGGLHFYFYLGDLENGDEVKNKINCTEFDLFKNKDDGSIDIITESIICEGSSYEFNGEKYEYKSIKGKINEIKYCDKQFNYFKNSFIRNPRKESEQLKQEQLQKKIDDKMRLLEEKNATKMAQLLEKEVQKNALKLQKDAAKTAELMEKEAEKLAQEMEKERLLEEERQKQEEFTHKPIEYDEICKHLGNIAKENGMNYDYKKWYEMGQTIKNLYPDDGFDLFDIFSQHCRAYDYKSVSNLWKGLSVREAGNNRTVGSILYLSKLANKEVYDIIRARFKSKNYRNVLEEFEANHFYFIPSNCVAEVDENGSIVTYSKEHSFDYFNTWTYEDKDGKKAPFIKRWWEDRSRRMILKIVSKSLEDCEKNEFPIFTNYHYENIDCDPTEEQREKAITSFNDLLSCVCNDEEIVTNYIRNTFAHLIQKPFIKNGKLIAFASPDEGTGKDTLMLIIMKIVGEHATAHYTSTDQFWDRHDTLSMGKPFIYLEEACSHQNKANEGRLKSKATSENISINPKGQKGINVPNIGRHFMTTNETQPFNTSQTDRRGIIIKPSTRLMKQDWNAFYKMLKSNWFIKSVGEYLYDINLTKWDANNDMPVTEIKKELQELSRSSEQQFLEQWEEKEWVTSGYLYRTYRSFCEENSLSHAQNAKSFGIKILHLKQYFKTEIDSRKVKYYAPIGLQKEFNKDEALL
jgi:hypothetical protein